MSQAEELLNSLSDVDSGHTHPVTDQDGYFIIDPETRAIRSANGERCTLMQFDHNSERYTFELPRFIEGHDMMLCNRVRVHFNNIQTDGRDEIPDVAEMYDLAVSANDPSKVVSSWLITRAATQLAGILSFLIQYECIEDGVAVYEWHTDIYADVDVKPGRNNGEQIAVQYSSILEQWYERLFGTRDSVLADIADATEAHKEALERKAEETLATIPSDYTELYNTATDALRTRANAIVENVEGDAIIANDCSSDYLRGLRIFGRSTQNGVPTPDAPVEILSVESPTVTVCGKNLIDISNPVRVGNCTTESNGNQLLIKRTNTQTVYSNVYLSAGVYAQYVGKTLIFQATNVTEEAWNMRIGHMVNGVVSDSGYIAADTFAAGESKTLLFTVPNNENSGELGIRITSSTNSISDGTTCVLENIQLEVGDVVTEYEPYRGNQTIALSHTLRGIPVFSGGNYTDVNGQQWICDEVDLARGVYVQRVGQMILANDRTYYYNADTNGKEFFYTAENNNVAAWETRMFCSHFPVIGGGTAMEGDYWTQFSGSGGIRFRHKDLTSLDELLSWLDSNQVYICYVLAEPVETALTDDEIFVFKMLHSNYPNTTILNDAGAWIEVAYNADTELFFNNSRGASDEQVANSVDVWLQAHFPNVAEVGM